MSEPAAIFSRPRAAALAFNALPLLPAEPRRRYAPPHRFRLVKKHPQEAMASGGQIRRSVTWTPIRWKYAERVHDLGGDQPKTYPDYRELLKEKPEIVIASPDHWHALQTIAA
jgi:hypothetical protein